MGSTSGIHAGFFWKLGEEGGLYGISALGSRSPLENPKFTEAFQNAQMIAFEFFQEQPLNASAVSSKEQLIPLAKETERYLTLEEIQACNEKLSKHFEEMPCGMPSGKLWEDMAPREQFVFGLYRLFSSVVNDQSSFHPLHAHARQSNKSSLFLRTSKEQETLCRDICHLLFASPAICLVKELLLLPSAIQDLHAWLKNKGKAWDLGFYSFFMESTLRKGQGGKSIDVEVLKQKFPDLEEQMKELTQKLLAMGEAYQESLCDRISDTFQKNRNTLVILATSVEEKLFVALTKRNLSLQGPLKEAIKPRGFLWEIRKADQVAGYFLGSVHVVPRWILENFNSRTLQAFESCDVLGVELDVTRENISGNKKMFYDPKSKAISVTVLKAALEDPEWNITEKLQEGDPDFIEKAVDLVSKAIIAKYGIDSGIDLFFIDKAKQRKISVVDLESEKTHLEFLALSLREQQRKGPLEQVKGDDSPQTLYHIHKRELIRQVCQLYPEELEMGFTETLENRYAQASEEVNQAMCRRNMEMALTTDRLIRDNKKPFSIAGALHFAGPMGMHKLLTNMGYKVTQIICEEPK